MSGTTADELNAAISAVVTDTGGLIELIGPISLRLVSPATVAAEPADVGWLTGISANTSRWILAAGGAETALDEPTGAALIVSIASFVQDRVIDESGRPWPDIAPYGVLDVRIIHSEAYWCRGFEPIAPVGKLASLDE
jgi:hypothetical protein